MSEFSGKHAKRYRGGVPTTVDAVLDVVLPSNDPTKHRELASFIDSHQGNLSLTADDESVQLGPEATRILKVALSILSDQMGVALSGVTTRLTTSEAAALLGISRPTLVRLLEEGKIAYEQPRKHRLVLLEDILSYQARMRNTVLPQR